MCSQLRLKYLVFLLLSSLWSVQSLYSQDILARSWDEYNKGHVDTARKLLNFQGASISESDSLCLLKAYLYYEEDDVDRALEFIDSALILNPSFAPAYILQGLIYYYSDPSESLVNFNKAIYIDPVLDTAYFYRSFLRIHMGDYQGALQDLTLCRKLNPQNTDVLFVKAATLFFLDKKSEAQKAMTEFESLSKDDSLVIFRKGQFLTLVGDTVGAIKQFTLLIDSGWYGAEARLRRAFLLQVTGDATGAIRDISDVITTDTSYPPLYLFRAAFYLEHSDTAKALEDFNSAIRIDSTYLPAIIARAEVNVGKKEYLEAIKDYTQLTNAGFYSSEIFQTIGELNESTKNYREAENGYSNALMLDDEDPELYFKRGKARYDGKRYQAAVSDFSEAIRLDTTNVKYYYYRGMAYDEMNELETAIKDYDHAIELDGEYASLYHMKGWALMHLERREEALEAYETAMELSPKNARYVCIHGNIYLQMKDLDKAMDDYQRAIRMDSLYAAPVSNIGLIYERRGDTLEALRWFGKAMQVDSTNVDSRYNKGRVLHNLKRYEEALPYLVSTTLVESKYKGEAHYYLGEVYRKLEKDSLAISSYRQSIDLNKFRQDSYASIGDIYRSTGQFELAKKEYEYATIIDTTYYGAWYSLAVTEKRLGNKERALICFRNSQRLESSYGDVDYWIGLLQYELKDYNGAINSFSKQITLSPKEHFSYYERARCFIETGDTARALVDLDEALLLRKSYSAAATLQETLLELPLSQSVLDSYKELSPDAIDVIVRYDTEQINKYKISDPERAMRLTNRAIREDSTSSELYCLKGEIALVLKDTLGAIRANTRSIQLNPDYFGAYAQRGFCYMITHDTDAAIFDFEKAVALRSNDIYSLNKLGFIYMKRGEYAKSLGFYERSYAVDNTIAVLRMCAYCKLMLKQNEEAAKLYRKLTLLQPNYAENYYFLGHSYAATSSDNDACQAFQTAKKLGFKVEITLLIKYCMSDSFKK